MFAKNKWQKFLSTVIDVIDKLKSDDVSDPFFRGHKNYKWKLEPTLARKKYDKWTENKLYYDFASLGGHLFPTNHNTWDILFLMRHHGLPCRLLDWTQTFDVALYLAVTCDKINTDAAIWILNPYELNKITCGDRVIEFLDSTYPAGYEKYFIDDRNEEYGKFPASVLAIDSKPRNSRMVAQRGVFTLYRDFNSPMEEQFPEVVTKIIIPREIQSKAKQFLQLAGLNEYTLFPELDGLARYLKRAHSL